ncbi:MAG: hypothetical protein B6U76_09630 [Desulfurococcales archaeon ex4484_217_2]|nr:MAG: hypothetical protein B6U76_09630 [Desulfurococcales archaeon ex4484_217_2]
MSSKALIIMVLAIVLSVALLSLVYMFFTSGKQVVLRVSTTTSLYATGLLDRYAKFVSRGDNSGTHVRELMLWRKAGLNPKGKPWYIETGSGMSQTLMVAHEYAAYTLSDIGTYLKFSSKLTELKVLVDKGDILVNIYSAYLVRESKNEKYAKKFIDFIVSDKGQEIISSYGGEEFGRPLFYPVKTASIEELKRMWNELAEE